MVVSEQFARYCILCGGPLGVTSHVVEYGGQSVQVRTRCARCGNEAGEGWSTANGGIARSPALRTGDTTPDGVPLPDAAPGLTSRSPAELRREQDRLFDATTVQLKEHGFSGLSRLVRFPVFVLSNIAPLVAPLAPHFAGYGGQAGQQPRPGFSRIRLFYVRPPVDAPRGTLLVQATDRLEEEWLPMVARQHNAVSTLSWFASNFGTPELRNLKGGGAIHQFVNIAAFLAAPVRRRIVLITSGENLTWGVRQIGDPGLLTCAITTVEQASLFVAATGFAASTIESLMTRLQRLQPDSEEVRQLDRLLRLRV
ncbi:MAG: hypothetical protein ACR2JY_23930 [Chloroflexota bacterium]